MSRSLLITIVAVAVSICSISDAEAQSGRILYDQVIKIEIDLPPEMEAMRDRIPKERTAKRMLLFDETQALMRDTPKDELAEDEPSETRVQLGGAMMEIRTAGGRNGVERILHTALESGETREQREFMGRTFLIEGEQKSIPWRLTAEQGQYKGLLTHKAVATVDSTELIAWFSPEIPVPVGPEEYGGLPGAILLLDIDNGKTTFTATEIEMDVELAESDFERPTSGRKVSQHEFDNIVEEKMKELGAQRRGNGRVLLRSH